MSVENINVEYMEKLAKGLYLSSGMFYGLTRVTHQNHLAIVKRGTASTKTVVKLMTGLRLTHDELVLGTDKSDSDFLINEGTAVVYDTDESWEQEYKKLKSKFGTLRSIGVGDHIRKINAAMHGTL